MGQTVTISVRSMLATGAVVVAVVVAYLLGSGRSDASPAAAAAPATRPADVPSIAMTGTGESATVPDQMTFSVGVRTSASDVSDALESANGITSRILAALKEAGIDADDVQTQGPQRARNLRLQRRGPPVITGYAVAQNLAVLVRSLPDAGPAISAAASAGGNAVRLSDVRLRVGDPEAQLREAREAAITEAQEKAEQYAEATGQELGSGGVAAGEQPGRRQGAVRVPVAARRTRRRELGADPRRLLRAGGQRLCRLVTAMTWGE